LVCNPGKTQRLLNAVLQGRLEGVQIDDLAPVLTPDQAFGLFFADERRHSIKDKQQLVREANRLPPPLEPDGSNTVVFEVIRMPDSSGFGDYTESGIVIPAMYRGERVLFTSQMYLDCEPPISGGREIWGFPKKLGYPTLHVEKETLVGRLKWGEDLVALATMGYKHHDLTDQGRKTEEILKMMGKTQVNYK